MAGTKHFTRMHYHVSRGLRELVAPRQTMPKKEWEKILQLFNFQCSYCGEDATQENRGIVADHVVPATEYGEFVLGNVIPACQTCNDSRGNKCWREYLVKLAPPDVKQRIDIIEKHLQRHQYIAPTPESVFNSEEKKKYDELLRQWQIINTEAKELYESKHGGKRLRSKPVKR